jgi:hypothetical protein
VAFAKGPVGIGHPADKPASVNPPTSTSTLGQTITLEASKSRKGHNGFTMDMSSIVRSIAAQVRQW